MSQEGVPVKRRRENDPDEQPELRELIEKNISATQEIKTMVTDQIKKMEMNITEIKAMVNNQEKNILKKMKKLETQINAENKFLAMRSSYFEALFFGNFTEPTEDATELKNVDPTDFQNFLEVLHGEYKAIDDSLWKE
ncbi:hypothetical protein L3Y34_016430 [Caenorhabditis briggsae]|uniref:BTB domain-containing protein n=1 Tax=Caenorhabditis briggsae TaxID=6238 RepID=A0AAE9E033_CAEBR|nr:hypothetical protein L3Y34_016430 [Caenorhabditis briggsae]